MESEPLVVSFWRGATRREDERLFQKSALNRQRFRPQSRLFRGVAELASAIGKDLFSEHSVTGRGSWQRVAARQPTLVTARIAAKSFDPFFRDDRCHHKGGDRIRPPQAECRIEQQPAKEDTR